MTDIKEIYIQDTLSEAKKIITIENFLASPFCLYVCGITPYDYAHIGHARCYVIYDILVRLIRFAGGKVHYVQNSTDVNDKIIAKAIDQYGDASQYLQVANYYLNHFISCCHQLGCLEPDDRPKVSESISDIISFIEEILKQGYGYVADDGVYFDVTAYDAYGKLSKRTLDQEMISRLEGKDFLKKSEYDFALWKKNEEVPAWESPWGAGVPGWHIECSAMIKHYFQHSLDLHGGGKDLIFPHHENEKAQSECCQNYSLSKIWMHIAFINVNKEKMSKSLGNSIYIKDIFKVVDPMVFRYYLLTHHYGSPIEFNEMTLHGCAGSYQAIVKFFSNEPATDNDFQKAQKEVLDRMIEALTDDLNTALFIGLFFKNQKFIGQNKTLFFQIKSFFISILGLPLESIAKEETEQKKFSEIEQKYIAKLIAEREEARQQKNFIRADKIKQELIAWGVVIQDKKLS